MGKSAQDIANSIMKGDEAPPQWAEGAIIHIRKNESRRECKNYRPICLARIIYKIWTKLQNTQHARIMHLLTCIARYGYKSELFTIDAIIKNRTRN